MNVASVQRILGTLLMLFSVTMLPPTAVSLYFADGNWQPFLDAFIALLVLGAAVWWPVRRKHRDLRLRDGFLIVALFWVVLGVAGAAPLLLSEPLEMSVTDAVFEAISGFTTTGAIIFPTLESLPASVLYYRGQVEWLGGIGIVVLAVALLPMLGVGGMQLLRAETPGPVKDSKLTPRVTGTAKHLVGIYLGMTLACIGAYWLLAGMEPFDALVHGFTTVSTGGNSTRDASIGHYNNGAIEAVAIAFMLLGAINFSLHFIAWKHKRFNDYFRDPEFKTFVAILVVSIALYTVVLSLTRYMDDPGHALRLALFQAVSMQTTSGFVTDNFSLWPGALPVIVMISAFIGGCAGSTSGGMKVVRWLLMWKQSQREVAQLVHPSAELPVKLGQKPIDMRIVHAVWGFFGAYVVCFGVLMIGLISLGEDQVTAFSAIAACMTNTGTGLGDVAANFTSLSDPGKWICIVAMLLGRLEVFPILVLLSPGFWRR